MDGGEQHSRHARAAQHVRGPRAVAGGGCWALVPCLAGMRSQLYGHTFLFYSSVSICSHPTCQCRDIELSIYPDVRSTLKLNDTYSSVMAGVGHRWSKDISRWTLGAVSFGACRRCWTMACRCGTTQWCTSGNGGRERSPALGARSAPACRRGAQARLPWRARAMQGGRLSCAASPARCGVETLCTTPYASLLVLG